MKITWKQCLRLGVTLLIVFLIITNISSIKGYFSLIWNASFPLILGAIIAYAVNIPMSFYERNLFSKVKSQKLLKLKRPICLSAAILTLIVVISAISAIVIPKLLSCVKLMIDAMPLAFAEFRLIVSDSKMLSTLITDEVLNSLNNIDWNNLISNALRIVSRGVGGIAETLSKAAISVFSGVLTFLMSFIFSVYLLASKERVIKQFNTLTNKFMRKNINLTLKKVVAVFNQSFHNFIVGQCIEACILGILCIIGMLIFRFDNAALIGTLVGFTSLIPIAGAYIGAIVGALILLTVSPMTSLFFIIFVIILQQLEGNIIYPKVVGASVGLPGIWTFAAVVLGGGLYGVMGMLVGVPLAATIYKLLKHHVRKINRTSKNSGSK